MPRSFIFTLDNCSHKEENKVDTLGRGSQILYFVYARQQAENGTLGLQGYICFKIFKRLSTVTNEFLRNGLDRVYIRSARGTPKKHRDDCTQGGDYRERGELPTKSGRTLEKERFAHAVTCAKRGREEEIDSDIYRRFYNNIKMIKADHAKKM